MKLPRIRFVDELSKWINITRFGRIHDHYLAIKEELVPKNKKTALEIEFFSKKIEEYYKKALFLYNFRRILYVVLYASLIVSFMSAVSWLSVLIPFIELGSSLFSTTFVFIVIVLLSIRLNLHIELMNECLSHLIVVYHQNPKRNSEDTLQRVSKAI